MPPSGSTFPVGTTTVTCTATDAHGNTGSASFHVTITAADSTPPHITVPAAVTAEATGPAGAVVSYSASATDDVAVATFGCVPASGATFPLGTTTVTCTATDTSGNTATASFGVTVVDTTPPAIAGVPADVTVAASSASGAVVTYASPTATDLVDGTRPVTCTPASGSTFPVGTTTVQCTAADTRGNTAHASFRVTVTAAGGDHTKPRLDVPHDLKVEATGPAGAVVTFTVTATDPDDAPATIAIACTPPSGSTFPIGKTTVSCTATDPAGNSSTKTFHVTVRDTTAPALAGVPDDTTVDATAPAGTVVTWPAPTATDAVDGAVTVACTPSSGSTFRIGTTKVHCTAADAHGNKAKVDFDVTVNRPPKDGRIVLVAAFGGHCDPSGATVCSIDVHGASLRAVPAPGAQEIAFSRDGRRMVFDLNGRGLAIANADGSGVTTLIDGWHQIDHPSWSPDGGQIAFAGSQGVSLHLYVINSDGSGLRVLGNPADVPFASEPAWSPNGDWIAFDSLADSRMPESATNPGGVYLVHPDGTGWHRISPQTSLDQTPAWSPDGAWLVVARLGLDWQTTHISSLWRMSPDGSHASQLTSGSWDGDAVVSPNGKLVAFYRYQGTQIDPHVYVMNADGSSSHQVLGLEATPEDWIAA
jgi:hypothetical protein